MTVVSWQARLTFAVTALAAAAVTWAALPMSGAGAGGRPALIVAALSAACSVVQLAARTLADRRASARQPAEVFVPAVVQLFRRSLAAFGATPWSQLMIVAVIALEALHPSRPWHTVVLGLLLVGYVLALHLAETGSRPAVLHRQLPLLTAGLGLAALSAAAAMLPGSSAGSGWLSAIAAVAAVIAAGLALPV
jgi:hypothetical protein